MKRSAILTSILVLPAFALAQTETPAKAKAPAKAVQKETAVQTETAARTETAPTFEIEEMKFTSGIEKKMPVDEKSTFATGERAWMWLKLKPATDTATVSFKWSWDGKHVWTSDPRAVRLGRTWFYKTVDQPGEWKVQILDNNNTVIQEASITVAGEPVYNKEIAAAPAAAPAPETATADTAPARAEPAAAGAEPAATPTESENIGVVDLKLATEIKDRNPVAPSTTFAKGDKVFTWVKLHVKVPETQVKLRWYLNDAAIYTSDPVTVKQAAGWRTWLYKTVDTAGNWKVEVLDNEDKAVHAESFTVN